MNQLTAPPERSIDELRAGLADKLAELHRRAKHARALASPSTYLRNPWVQLGIAAAIGYALLDRRGRQHEGLVHAVVRSGLSAAAHVLVTRALAKGEP
jgi:hypothetical protein